MQKLTQGLLCIRTLFGQVRVCVSRALISHCFHSHYCYLILSLTSSHCCCCCCHCHRCWSCSEKPPCAWGVMGCHAGRALSGCQALAAYAWAAQESGHRAFLAGCCAQHPLQMTARPSAHL